MGIANRTALAVLATASPAQGKSPLHEAPMYPTLEVCPKCSRKSLLYFPLDEDSTRVLCMVCQALWYVRSAPEGLIVKKASA